MIFKFLPRVHQIISCLRYKFHADQSISKILANFQRVRYLGRMIARVIGVLDQDPPLQVLVGAAFITGSLQNFCHMLSR